MRILFVSDSFRTGGIQRALIDLLNNYNFGDSEVDLFLFNSHKKNEIKLKSHINIIKSNFLISVANFTSSESKKAGFHVFILRKIMAIFSVLFGSPFFYKCLFFNFSLDSKYDIAISFTNNVNNRSLYFGSNLFVLKKVHAKLKYTWIHIHPTKNNIFNKYNYSEFLKFDKILCVSNAVKLSFINYWPEFSEKAFVVYNFIDKKEILNKSLINTHNVSNRFNIITVSRLDNNKSPLSVIDVALALNKENIPFTWYILGDGPLKTVLLNSIKLNNLADRIIVLGEVDNPYHLVKSSNLFVSFSLSESFGLAISESLVLQTPVLANYYDAISEIIVNGVNGIYLKYELVEFTDRIIHLIKNPKFYSDLKQNTKQIIDNELSTKQLNYILGYAKI